jgi:hypothetical protein
MRSVERHSSRKQKKHDTKREEAQYQSKDAEFLTWQKIPTGEIVAMFNIIDQKHPSYGSTVTADTLHNLNLEVPSTPPKPPSYPLFKFPNK